MAKRLTDTNKYKKPFIRGLQGAYKLFWDYLYHDCDHAGIWIVDFEIAQLYIGKDMPVNYNDALKYFNEGEIRIIPFDDNKKWLIKSFIEFQYGILNPENRVHNSVLNELIKYNFNKGLINTLQGCKEKEKEKKKDMDNEKEEEVKVDFEIFWNLYDKKFGSKDACKKKWDKLTFDIQKIIMGYLPEYLPTIKDKQFQPYPETWLNQKRWENEIIIEDNPFRIKDAYHED